MRAWNRIKPPKVRPRIGATRARRTREGCIRHVLYCSGCPCEEHQPELEYLRAFRRHNTISPMYKDLLPE